MNPPPLQASATTSAARRFEVVAWIGLWAVLRALLLLALCDVFVYGEELEKACAGKAMLDGLGLPHHQLAYHYYEGGGFVVSHLDAAAFALLGESVLSIKLVALALGAAILLAGWKLAESAGGRACARAFAALYVFAPESVQANSLLALGIHYHANLFTALIGLYALRVALERGSGAVSWFALGLASGFGCYFSYGCALTVAAAGAVLVAVLRREALSPRIGWAALGAAIGAAPLAWMASRVGREVLDIHGSGLLGGAPKGATLARFVTSLSAGRGPLDLLALAALAAAPLLALAALRRSEERALRLATVIVGLGALLYLGAYLASAFTVGTVFSNFHLHRLTPLWFAGALLTAFGFAAALRGAARALRRTASATVVVLATLGAVDTFAMVRDAAPGDWISHAKLLARVKGYSYPQYLQKLAPHMQGATLDKLRVLLRFREQQPQALHDGIAIALYGDGAHSLEALQAELDAVGIGDKRSFYRGLGLMLMRHHGVELAPLVAVAMGFPPDIRDPLLESIGRFGHGERWELATEDTVRHEADTALAAHLLPAFFTGLGRRFHDSLGDLRIEHYFERRKGPVALDRARGQRLLDDYPEAAAGPMRAAYDATHLERLLDAPWWWP